MTIITNFIVRNEQVLVEYWLWPW